MPQGVLNQGKAADAGAAAKQANSTDEFQKAFNSAEKVPLTKEEFEERNLNPEILNREGLEGGTDGNDTLAGTDGNDNLIGFKGDDVFQLGGGTDHVWGGIGHDRAVVPGSIDDYTVTQGEQGGLILINKETGEKKFLFNMEEVTFSNNGADNTVSTQELLNRNSNSDLGIDLTTQLGGPQLTDEEVAERTGEKNITHVGSDSSDRMVGTDGADKMMGFEGDDLIAGGAGNDYIRGNAGDDTLIGGQGNDTLKGGNGFDAAILGGRPEDYEITEVKDGVYDFKNKATGEIDRLHQIEQVTFGSGPGDASGGTHSMEDMVNGTFTPTPETHVPETQQKPETRHQPESRYQPPHNHNPAPGPVYLRTPTLQQGERQTTINDLSFGSAVLKGTEFNDYMRGLNGNDTLVGGDGDDVLIGSTGNDVLLGGNGVDKAYMFGHSSQWEIVQIGPDRFSVTNRVTGERDILVDVELIRFDNGTFQISN